MIKKLFKILDTFLPMQRWVMALQNGILKNGIISKWEKAGRPSPPPHQVKQSTIKEYQSRYQFKTLVETGTYLGDMIEAQRKNFEQIYSIELGVDLWNDAVKRFKRYPQINILQGDSGKMLNKITEQLNEPAIFWLDGHYSAGITAKGDLDCPIYGEIDAIFNGKKLNHVILVDDARCFVGKGDYPTVDNLTKYIQSKNSSYSVAIENDTIRYTAD
jgi:hypothetical protein